MNRMRNNARRLAALVAAMAAGAAVLAGCQSADDAGAGAAPKELAASAEEGKMSGSKVWGERCQQCHWVRPPDSYSDGQWAAIMHHMRQRANLTGPEQRAVLEFLQASN